MNRFLRVEHRCKAHRVSSPRVLRVLRSVLQDHLHCADYDLTFHFVDDTEMERVNRAVLNHSGTTDVITQDYEVPGALAGEIHICVEEAARQAARFGAGLSEELARYMIHALLHMSGYDDQGPQDRRRMKRRENAILRAVRQSPGTASLARCAASS